MQDGPNLVIGQQAGKFRIVGEDSHEGPCWIPVSILDTEAVLPNSNVSYSESISILTE